jgi:hypothetical protein
LGRCHRVIGKFIESSPDSARHAEEALQRALSINPRLTIAHKFYANLEAETGQGERAIVRLLNEVGDDQDQLPLLQHVLMRAWDHWAAHRSGDEPIDVPNYEGPITCELQVEDGSTVAFGTFELHQGIGQFSKTIRVDVPRLRGARLVTSTGATVASATFTSTARRRSCARASTTRSRSGRGRRGAICRSTRACSSSRSAGSSVARCSTAPVARS